MLIQWSMVIVFCNRCLYPTKGPSHVWALFLLVVILLQYPTTLLEDEYALYLSLLFKFPGSSRNSRNMLLRGMYAIVFNVTKGL